jgi:hypothetical protein
MVGLENGVIWCIKACSGASVNCIIEREREREREKRAERKKGKRELIRNQEEQKDRKRPD